MRRGRRGPGLVGTMARTAVIAGTASATVGAVQSHSAKKQAAAQQGAAQDQQVQQLQAEVDAMQQQAAPAAAAPAGEVDVVTELQKLADMKTQGILTDEQFEAAKAKLLAG